MKHSLTILINKFPMPNRLSIIKTQYLIFPPNCLDSKEVKQKFGISTRKVMNGDGVQILMEKKIPMIVLISINSFQVFMITFIILEDIQVVKMLKKLQKK